MAIDSLSGRQSLASGLTGASALRAYQTVKNESETTAARYQASGGQAAALTRGGNAVAGSNGTGLGIAGGTYAAIDANLAGRSRYLDDVYLSEESKARLAADGAAPTPSTDSANLFQRAYETAERSGPDGEGGNLAGEIADVLGDLVALARHGLTEVDSQTAREDLASAAKSEITGALADRFTEAGLSKGDAEAVAGLLTDRIMEGVDAGGMLLNLSVQQTATRTETTRHDFTAGGGSTAGRLGVESLRHLGGTLSLEVSVNTNTGEIRVLQSAAAVHQTADRVSLIQGPGTGIDPAASRPSDAPGLQVSTQPSGQTGTLGAPLERDGPGHLAETLRRLVGSSEQLEKAEAAQAVVDLLSALTDRSEQAEKRGPGGVTAINRNERDDPADFAVRVPFPPIAAATDAEGRSALLFPHATGEGVARLSLSGFDRAV